jgi:hypothetical protein
MRFFVSDWALVQTVGPRGWGRDECNCGRLWVTVGDRHVEVGSPTIVHNLDAPQLVLGVTPPLEDDCAIERDFAAM